MMSRRCLRVGKISFLLVAVTLIVLRLHFGLSLEDEAFYAALTIAFSKGRHLFTDELIFVQFSSFLLVPLAKFHSLIQGSNEGIILYFRYCFIAFLGLFSVQVWQFFRARIGSFEAALLALMVLSFWPFRIPALSYNTMGTLFFGMGGLLWATDIERQRMSSRIPGGAALFCLAIFSYPTLGPVVVLSALLAIGSFPKNKILNIFSLTALGLFALGLGLMIFIFKSVGQERFLEIYDFLRSYGVHGATSDKLRLIRHQARDNAFFGLLLLVFVGGPLYLLRKNIWAAWGLFFILGFILFSQKFFVTTISPYHLVMTYLPCLGIFVWLKRRSHFEAADRFLLLSSLGAGLLTAWSSSNGLHNFCLGALVAAILSLALASSSERKVLWKFIVLGLVVFQIIHLWKDSYSDDSPQYLNHKIASGPYRGIYTSDRKDRFVRQLQADLDEVSAGRKTLAIFDYFAAGYLFSSMQMQSPLIWTYSLSQFPSQKREVLSRFYEQSKNIPDVLLWMSTIPGTSQIDIPVHTDRDDLLRETLFKYNFKKVIKRAEYEVYVLP